MSSETVKDDEPTIPNHICNLCLHPKSSAKKYCSVVNCEHKQQKDPSICPHGKMYLNCQEPECMKEMLDAEEAAYCPHGYLVGCPIC